MPLRDLRPGDHRFARAPGGARYPPAVAVLFVFVDGVGAGARDPDANPLAREPFLLSRFADGGGAPLPDGGRAVLADATLGVPGRPQSATGQSTILTGENAPRLLGRHLLGYPNAPLRALLRERSLFGALAAAGRRAVFANAYPVAYLRALGLEAEGEPEFATDGRRRARPAATTVAYAAGGGRFRTWDDAGRGAALTHDITGARARVHGARLSPRAPEDAAAIFLDLARDHDLATRSAGSTGSSARSSRASRPATPSSSRATTATSRTSPRATTRSHPSRCSGSAVPRQRWTRWVI
ncbi:hypothetical protein AMOR_07270 [Anaeromyxobacter oryzae]|uniref:Metalloenzyme domain-containing protein n=1 Tax=Anaeromyxobacter oryzae TaxID=2918170 RepID=A0ABM7WQJ4_9BACT|nr:hypothetical protein AMOR_07270 [Anaeromyxobacter oryzae]